jgi:hypothetical protein
MKRERCTTPRTVKIAARHYEHQTYPTYRKGRWVPALRLAGDWLEQIGFTEGAKVNVAAENGRLVLTVAE